MLPDLLGGLVVAALFAVPFVTRRLRADRRVRAAGTASPSAALPQPVAEGRVQPGFVSVSARVPYDSGPLLAAPEEDQ